MNWHPETAKETLVCVCQSKCRRTGTPGIARGNKPSPRRSLPEKVKTVFEYKKKDIYTVWLCFCNTPCNSKPFLIFRTGWPEWQQRLIIANKAVGKPVFGFLQRRLEELGWYGFSSWPCRLFMAVKRAVNWKGIKNKQTRVIVCKLQMQTWCWDPRGGQSQPLASVYLFHIINLIKSQF